MDTLDVLVDLQCSQDTPALVSWGPLTGKKVPAVAWVVQVSTPLASSRQSSITHHSPGLTSAGRAAPRWQRPPMPLRNTLETHTLHHSTTLINAQPRATERRNFFFVCGAPHSYRGRADIGRHHGYHSPCSTFRGGKKYSSQYTEAKFANTRNASKQSPTKPHTAATKGIVTPTAAMRIVPIPTVPLPTTAAEKDVSSMSSPGKKGSFEAELMGRIKADQVTVQSACN